jgi:hypothetical protein
VVLRPHNAQPRPLCQYELIANVCYVLISRYYAFVPKARGPMTSPTEERKRIKELRKDFITCQDPFNLLAEYSYENEKLRKQVSLLTKAKKCSLR